LAALRAQFDADAERYHIYPLIDWDDVFHKRIHNHGTPVTATAGQMGPAANAAAAGVGQTTTNH
jgi:hypothetical protein